MTFTHIDVAQRTPEWHLARLGRVTGSGAAHVLDFLKKGGETAKRAGYRRTLVCERLTGIVGDDIFVSKEMRRGNELEASAFARYSAITGKVVKRTGFLSADELMVGCSLDGHVDNFLGIVELKCPKTETHIDYLLGGVLPEEYAPQVRHNLWVSGADWCDFVSFDDRLQVELQTVIVRTYAKDVDLPGYSAKVTGFLEEIAAEVKQVMALAGRAA